MVILHCLVGIIDFLSDDIAYLICSLSKQLACTTGKAIGRSVLIVVTSRLVLRRVVTTLRSVPCVPLRGVVYLIS